MEALLSNFIDRIEREQLSGNRYFPEGIFPAYRSNRSVGYKRPDTTIFFSAISAFTLQSLKPKLGAQLQSKIDNICQRIVVHYPDFQNKDGLKTYNFWKTKPSRHFPNGHIFKRYEHFRIPDDVDDTSFVYLTTNPSHAELLWLKDKLSLHANGSRNQWIRNTYPEYKKLPAYSTWFGKNMYIEFDVSVLCNLMYCILKNKLPLNEHDHGSLEYIKSVVETDRYLTVPFRCAHQYPRTALIIYHVARLIAVFEPAALQPIRKKLIEDTQKLLESTDSKMDRVILSSSLMRLGIPTPRIEVENFTKKDFDGFYFFIAGLLTAYENPILYGISNWPLFHMYWTCEAHCWVLLLEYEVLYNQVNQLKKEHL